MAHGDKPGELDCVPTPAFVADQLSQPVRMKTWSLIVTVFGDAIMPRGGKVYASHLNAIMEAMGVNSGAVRTALSRLANDGIIKRERDGRSSIYRLAEDRERQFREAALRIYALPEGQAVAPEFVMVSGGSQVAEAPCDDAIRLSREWWLVDQSLVKDGLCENHAVFEGRFAQLPKWLIDRVALPELAVAMHHLNGVFEPVLLAVEDGWEVTPLQALALRCLLIHAWRRIALRLRVLPEEFEPANWPEKRSRELVSRLYGLLTVGGEKWLDEVLEQPVIRPVQRFPAT